MSASPTGKGPGDAPSPAPPAESETEPSVTPAAGPASEPALASTPAPASEPDAAPAHEPARRPGDERGTAPSAPPAEPSGARSPRRVALALGAAALAATVAQQFAASYALAASVGSFAAAYLVAERAGASWSSQPFTPRARAALARAALYGLAPALAAALAGWASGGLRWRPGALSLGLAASVLREAFEAARHETLFRWLPWALARSRVPRPWLVGFQVLAGVAPLLLAADPIAWALGAALGLLCAGLLETSGLWAAPIVAHATLRIATAVLVPLLFDVRWREGSWSPLDHARGVPAFWLTAALGLAAAAFWAGVRGARGSARHQDGHGDDKADDDHAPEHDAPHDGL